MKKTAILLCTLLGMPLLANAGVSVNISTPGVNVQIGDQDHRGYYWDGYDWRGPRWWKEHNGRHVGMHGSRGYWNGHGWQPQRPGPNASPPRQQHDERRNAGEAPHGGNNHDGNRDGNAGGNNHDGNRDGNAGGNNHDGNRGGNAGGNNHSGNPGGDNRGGNPGGGNQPQPKPPQP